jgi:hypothetical protein
LVCAVEKRAGRLSYVRRRQHVHARVHGGCGGGCLGFSPSRPIARPAAEIHRDNIARCFTKVSAGMDDEPREQISELEVQIEELTDALERCRKTALASKAAMGLGGILMSATTLGVVTFDPMMMVAGFVALLGGIVVFGSNTSTANQLSEAMRSAEAQRIGFLMERTKCEFALGGFEGGAERPVSGVSFRPKVPEPDWQAPLHAGWHRTYPLAARCRRRPRPDPAPPRRRSLLGARPGRPCLFSPPSHSYQLR